MLSASTFNVKCPISTSKRLENIKANKMETGKYFKKRMTISGKPLYFTKIKGATRGTQDTTNPKRMATET